MRFIADLHIHSRYSRATSRKLTPEWLDYWARIKGIQVVATGDCLHPDWADELKEKLEPTACGLYQLKACYRIKENLPESLKEQDIYFILQTELSSIYKKNGSVRKVHTCCIFPDFNTARHMQDRLDCIGNIRSDGRPILGLDAKEILEMVLESHPQSFLFPAHIWTPWFSMLGSKSGFNSIEECFEDLSAHIFCVETGLSSDPPMNRRCSFLDGVRLISNSDAHSPEKLGREANIFDCERSYEGIYNALKNDQGFLGTIEFFPEEGKYHYDGHRQCSICWAPQETIAHNGICPVCKKPVTQGVLYRVNELADRQEPQAFGKQTYQSITPLPAIMAEMLQRKNSASKTVTRAYNNIIAQLGAEFDILLVKPINEIAHSAGDTLAEGINRMRNGQIAITGGFDGEFGKIKVFTETYSSQPK